MKTTPLQLKTPTDINQASVKEITDAINPLIADAFALYVKTKNFHWHVYGPHFHDYHELFDGQASAILGSIDTLAERVRKIGGVTIQGISDIQSLTQIKDCEDFPDAEEMMAELLDDNKKVVSSMRDAMEICEENDDKATSNILQGLIDEAEKRVWFLFEITS